MRLVFFLWLCFIMPLAGCFPAPTTPIPTLEYRNPAARNNPKLLILLRGIWGGNDIFEREGMIQEVLDRKLPFDMVAPDSHFGYFRSETLPIRLHEDIILPARAKGYREIWIAGVSMGGLGSWFFLMEYPEDIDGIIMFSPFLGWGGIVEEIQEEGDIHAWQPGEHTVKDWERYLWAFIKKYLENQKDYPPIYLGYGDSDFFREEQAELAKYLPPSQVMVINGSHNNGTMKQLWKAYLDRLNPLLRR
ncbi:hypothetical protein C2E25_06115 [Geothermobacter hydrogeniphilus]|uniref:Alpha/beta hydrolase n=1 Tax=Geothermobacter hydrogeniphilus TaxID=1969733 RepID=A0A2K2HBC3_9BACT|nr:alpha/beta hydrolase [Geothermobacter hydrogeniphilus]PNU20616.1 hypothetical protein C2E25_06115 [Geothermobacter hydrogeniphilus]